MPSLSRFLFILSFLCYCADTRTLLIHPDPILTMPYDPPLTTGPVPPLTTSSANASSQLFPNISLTSTAGFSYIIPYGRTQDCNIYGPICQIGSITVGVNLTTATTSTVLPCSSYLSAQSAYLVNENENLIESNPDTDWGEEDPKWLGGFDDYLFGDSELMDWNINFGQSPECRSYARAMRQGQYTFSDCGSSNKFIQTVGGLNYDYPSQLPPGVVQEFDSYYTGTCCGNCSLEIPEVRLYYFPDKTATDCQNNQTSNMTLVASSHQSLRKRVHSLVANGNTAIVSGHTFTSPSVYLQLMGTATVVNQCTTIGPKLTNPIVTFAPGELSTWQPVNPYDDSGLEIFTIGQIWADPKGGNLEEFDIDFTEGIAPLDIKDLACPTWGLGFSTSDDGTVITTIGPPYLPIIIPPMNVFSLDPTWASACTAMYTDSAGRTTLALFDPPIALTTAALLLPTQIAPPVPANPTAIPQTGSPSAQPAKPASLPIDPVAPPARTGDPGKNNPTQSPVIPSADQASLPDSSASSPNEKGDPPPDRPAGYVAPSLNVPDPPSGGSHNSPTDPNLPIVPMPPPDDGSQVQTQGLGSIIYNGVGESGPEFDDPSVMPLPSQATFTISSITFTANLIGFKINGAVISPGGTAYVVDGTTINLDQSGLLTIGSSTISLLKSPPTSILEAAGQIFTPNPSAFSIADTFISAGGPAVTIKGTPISLDRSGVLNIGSITIPLTDPSPTSFSSKVFTVGGETFTPNPLAFSIAGTTISADGPAVTISGTMISLGRDGALEIGSSTIALGSPSEPPPNKVYTVAGQTFTPNPSDFPIDGTILSAGGPAVTLDGTIISLGQSGILAMGSTTVNLPTQSYTPGMAYTVAGQTFTPNPSSFSIAGTTISAGGPAATVDGTIVSLEPSGTLLVGSSTITLSTTQFPTDINIDGYDVNVQSSFVVVDGVTISDAAAGVTVSGTIISLEAGGATLDIGTGRFALPKATSAVNVQAFTGGQGKGIEFSLFLFCGVCGVAFLLL